MSKLTQFVMWAEDKGFIKFYGIRDIEQMLQKIRDYLLQPEIHVTGDNDTGTALHQPTVHSIHGVS